MSSGMSGVPYEGQKTVEAFKEIARDESVERTAELLTAKEAMIDQAERQAPYRKAQLDKRVEKKDNSRRINRGILSEKKETLESKKVLEDKADRFSQRTKGELRRQTLTFLRKQITPDLSKEQILEKVEDITEQKDPFLIAETLEFLEETTEGPLHNEVVLARDEFITQNQREVTAARNTRAVVYEKGIGEYKDIRALYYDLIRTPRQNTGELVVELSNVYNIDEQQVVLDCLLQAAGADSRSEGPSIEPGLLSTILNTIRSLQAIRGAYNFFNGRMGLVEKKFAAEGQRVPSALTFVRLTEQFINLCKDQYPSSAKVFQLAPALGVERNVTGQITAFEQMRDGVRQVARDRIFHSVQHRDEVQEAIINALEELEDQAASLEMENVEEREWDVEE